MASLDVKVVFLGGSGVGKTSIVNQFLNHAFNAESAPTLGAAFLKLESDGVNLQFWDVAGAETYRTLAKNYYQGAHSALIVYATDNPTTLSEAREWEAQLKEDVTEMPALILVGNKVDIEPRAVSVDDGEKLAEEIGALHLETSAKTRQGIDDLLTYARTEGAKRAQKAQATGTRAQEVGSGDEPLKSGLCC
jgi:small GTP-binding protein